MTNGEAVNWLINLTADIGKAEHSDLWHYEQALSEIREMLEDAQPETHDKRTETHACDLIDRQAAIDFVGSMNMCDQIDDEAYKVLTNYLEQLPSVQPQRSKGRWESYLTDGLKYKCSECGSRYIIPWHFCPNCGTDMRKQEEQGCG